MSRKKISTTIYVTPEQSDRLRVLHERTKVPVAVYIREGIDLVLRQYGHLLPGQLPLDRTGQQEPASPIRTLQPESANAVAEPRVSAQRADRASSADVVASERTASKG
jgi:hypothetical protein